METVCGGGRGVRVWVVVGRGQSGGGGERNGKNKEFAE
jgi:hypothetical protein